MAIIIAKNINNPHLRKLPGIPDITSCISGLRISWEGRGLGAGGGEQGAGGWEQGAGGGEPGVGGRGFILF